MILKELSDIAYARFLAVQRLYRLTGSDIFEKAYKKATDKEKEIIVDLVKSGTLNELKSIVDRLGTDSLEDKPIMELRKIARRYGVKEYNTIPKSHLIEGISDAIRTLTNITPRDEALCVNGSSRGG